MKWVKLGIGVILGPALVAVALSFLHLATAGWTEQVWQQSWFWALLGGLLLWMVMYLVLPRPMWIYVFGHELTHALAVYLQGGKVYGFRVGERGGHVKTDTVNWWITLAPYFIPLYCLIWIGLWWSVNFYYPLRDYLWILYGGVGVTWGFHLTFSVSMIKIGQSDLESQGTLFSCVVILMINLLLIELFLVGVLPKISYLHWAGELGSSLMLCYKLAARVLWQGVIWCWHWVASLFK